MGKKTMVSMNLPTYEIKNGSFTLTGNKSKKLSYASKIIMVLFRVTASSTDACIYCYNQNADFWKNSGVSFSGMQTDIFKTHHYNSSQSIKAWLNSDYEVEIDTGGASSGVSFKYNYIVILENNTSNVTPFLLSNTILYTDGTVSSNVSGAIETLDTNKYKIKTNALVNVADATYVDISN